MTLKPVDPNILPTTSSNTNSVCSFSKGSLVKILGLKSREGEKLNGAFGIALGPSCMDEHGVERVPVRIFSLPEPVPKGLQAPQGHQFCITNFAKRAMDKKIKLCNLSETETPMTIKLRSKDASLGEMPLLEAAARQNIAMATLKMDRKACSFWTEHLNMYFPNLFDMAVSYAHILMDDGNHLKAAEVVSKAFPFLNDTKENMETERFATSCYVACMALSGGTKENLLQALDCIMDIPLNASQNIALFEDASRALLLSCSKFTQAPNQLKCDIDLDVAQINVKLLKTAYGLHPDRLDYVISLGLAYCLSGDWLQGAKYCRRGLSILKKDPKAGKNLYYSMEDIQIQTILAQLHCPGMLLEHYTDMYVSPTQRTVTAVLIAHRDRFSWHGGVIRVRDPQHQPEIKTVCLPESIDDEEFFPASFLEQCQWTGE
jgi:hypothetical protein